MHSLTLFAVDAFVFISGWFGVRFSPAKVLRFLGLGLFVSCMLWLLASLFKINAGFQFSLGWFGLAYLALMCLSPIVNAGLDALANRGDKGLVLAWLSYTGLMLFNWLPLSKLGIITAIPGCSEITLNTVLYVYVTARVARLLHWDNRLTIRRSLLFFVFLLIGCFAWGAVAGFSSNAFIKSFFTGSRGDNSPLVVATAFFAFIIFLKLRIPTWLSRAFCFLSPSLFAIYLMHDGCNRDIASTLYNRYAVVDLGSSLAGHLSTLLLACFIVFCSCLAFDLIRRFILSLILKGISYCGRN